MLFKLLLRQLMQHNELQFVQNQHTFSQGIFYNFSTSVRIKVHVFVEGNKNLMKCVISTRRIRQKHFDLLRKKMNCINLNPLCAAVVSLFLSYSPAAQQAHPLWSFIVNGICVSGDVCIPHYKKAEACSLCSRPLF